MLTQMYTGPAKDTSLPRVLTEIAAASLAAVRESVDVVPCPPLWRCGPCDYSTASAAEYTRHCSKGEHAARIARARLEEFMTRTSTPCPSSRDAWTLGGRYDPERSAYMHEAWRFFGELRKLRRAGCTVRCYMIPETNVLQVEFRRVARPRPVPPDVGDAVHEWAEAADAEQAHESAVAHGGA